MRAFSNKNKTTRGFGIKILVVCRREESMIRKCLPDLQQDKRSEKMQKSEERIRKPLLVAPKRVVKNSTEALVSMPNGKRATQTELLPKIRGRTADYRRLQPNMSDVSTDCVPRKGLTYKGGGKSDYPKKTIAVIGDNIRSRSRNGRSRDNSVDRSANKLTYRQRFVLLKYNPYFQQI